MRTQAAVATEPKTEGFAEDEDKSKSQEVTHTVAVNGALPTEYNDMDDMTGAGLEAPRPEERRPSFLYLLQGQSKPAMRGTAEYVDGAAAGMFYSSGTRRLFDGDKGVEFIPVFRELRYVEWTPFDEGGGYHGDFGPDDPEIARWRTPENRFKALKTDRGTELVQTFSIYALIGAPGFDASMAEAVAIPFTSIKIKHYNQWYDRARNIRYPDSKGRLVVPDIFHHRWLLTAVFEPKWDPSGAWNVRIALAGGTNPRDSFISKRDPIYQVVKETHDAIKGGLRADYAAAEGDAAGGVSGGGASGGAGSHEDPPF